MCKQVKTPGENCGDISIRISTRKTDSTLTPIVMNLRWHKRRGKDVVDILTIEISTSHIITLQWQTACTEETFDVNILKIAQAKQNISIFCQKTSAIIWTGFRTLIWRPKDTVKTLVRPWLSRLSSNSIFIVPYSPYGGIGPFTIKVFYI